MSPTVIRNGYRISPHVNLKMANLRYADLSNLNLSGCDFTGADLRGADLNGIIIDLKTKFTNVLCNPEQLEQINIARQNALKEEQNKYFVTSEYFNLTITNLFHLKTLTTANLPHELINIISSYFMVLSFPINQIQSMGNILRYMDKITEVINNDSFWKVTKTKSREFLNISFSPFTLFSPVCIQKSQEKLKSLTTRNAIEKYESLLETQEIYYEEDDDKEKRYFTGDEYDSTLNDFCDSLRKNTFQEFLVKYPEAEEKPNSCRIQ
jgi:pentapeptide repeat protein